MVPAFSRSCCLRACLPALRTAGGSIICNESHERKRTEGDKDRRGGGVEIWQACTGNTLHRFVFLTKVCQSENNAADISLETVFKGVRRVCVFCIFNHLLWSIWRFP